MTATACTAVAGTLSGMVGGGTRVMVVGTTVRTIVVHHGTPPGPSLGQ